MKSTLKDPDSIEDFKVDWSADLGSDTIADSAWIVPSALTKVTDAHDTTSATARLSGGVAGALYDVVNRITTAGGQVKDFTIRILMAEQ